MLKLLVGTFCALLFTTASAESQSSANQNSKIFVASGAVYWSHCDKRCDELKCSDKKICYNACVENKGTVSMCPAVQGKGK